MTRLEHPGPPTPVISREEMDAHVAAGRAHPWTESLNGIVPLAAQMNGTWYVVRDGEDYEQATEPVAAELTSARNRLAAAADLVRAADARRHRP